MMKADDIVKIEVRTIIGALYHPDDRVGLATRGVTRKRDSPAVTPMTRTGATLTGTAIPFVWRLRMLLHGVRLSRLAYDEVTTDCDEPRTYRAAMTDEDLVGIDSAPLAVRINLRAASFVLRAFAQQTAELRADHSGALIAIHCAPDGACHPIASHSTQASELVAINGARDPA